MTMHDELRTLVERWRDSESLNSPIGTDVAAWCVGLDDCAHELDAILAEYADWVAVPREPDDHMRAAGFESQAFADLSDAVVRQQGWPYSCREAAECVAGVYRAMIQATEEKP